jgi:hypothetical protein
MRPLSREWPQVGGAHERRNNVAALGGQRMDKVRVYLVTANLMLVELGPQTPLDDEVRKQVVRLGWQRSKDK